MTLDDDADDDDDVDDDFSKDQVPFLGLGSMRFRDLAILRSCNFEILRRLVLIKKSVSSSNIIVQHGVNN